MAFMGEPFRLKADVITKHIRLNRKEGLSMDDEKVTVPGGEQPENEPADAAEAVDADFGCHE